MRQMGGISLKTFDLPGNILGLQDGSLPAAVGLGAASLASFLATIYAPSLPIPYVGGILKFLTLGAGAVLAYSSASQLASWTKKSLLPSSAEDASNVAASLRDFKPTTTLDDQPVQTLHLASEIACAIAIPTDQQEFSVIEVFPVVITLNRRGVFGTGEPIAVYVRAKLYSDDNVIIKTSNIQPITLAPGEPIVLQMNMLPPGIWGATKYYTVEIEVARSVDFGDAERVGIVGGMYGVYTSYL